MPTVMVLQMSPGNLLMNLRVCFEGACSSVRQSASRGVTELCCSYTERIWLFRYLAFELVMKSHDIHDAWHEYIVGTMSVYNSYGQIIFRHFPIIYLCCVCSYHSSIVACMHSLPVCMQ